MCRTIFALDRRIVGGGHTVVGRRCRNVGAGPAESRGVSRSCVAVMSRDPRPGPAHCWRRSWRCGLSLSHWWGPTRRNRGASIDGCRRQRSAEWPAHPGVAGSRLTGVVTIQYLLVLETHVGWRGGRLWLIRLCERFDWGRAPSCWFPTALVSRFVGHVLDLGEPFALPLVRSRWWATRVAIRSGPAGCLLHVFGVGVWGLAIQWRRGCKRWVACFRGRRPPSDSTHDT